MFLSKQFYIPRISTLRFLMESAFPDSSDQCIKCNLNSNKIGKIEHSRRGWFSDLHWSE